MSFFLHFIWLSVFAYCYVLCKTAISPSLKGVALCDKTYCLTLPLLLIISQVFWLPKQQYLFLIGLSCSGCAKTCQFFKGRDISQHPVQADWKLDPQATTFKLCKYIHSCGTTIITPVGLRTKLSGGVPWAIVAKIRASHECIIFYLGGPCKLWQGKEETLR